MHFQQLPLVIETPDSKEISGKSVRIPPYEKENKASSGAEDDAKSAEVGTREAGHRSDLNGGQSSAIAGKF